MYKMSSRWQGKNGNSDSLSPELGPHTSPQGHLGDRPNTGRGSRVPSTGRQFVKELSEVPEAGLSRERAQCSLRPHLFLPSPFGAWPTPPPALTSIWIQTETL